MKIRKAYIQLYIILSILVRNIPLFAQNSLDSLIQTMPRNMHIIDAATRLAESFNSDCA